MASISERFRPVVAFDVDGVIRVRKNDEVELITLPITMYRDEYPTLFHGSPRWDEQGEAIFPQYFSKPGVELLRKVATDESFDGFWATTWQHWANRYFGEPLGVPELPVAVKTLYPEGQNWYHCSHSWKSDQLQGQFDGRPLIWLDDSLPDRPGEELTAGRRPIDRALTLHYVVDPWTGLTTKDVEFIEEWLTLASSEEGHVELRARRAKAEAKKRAEQKRWSRENERKHRHFKEVRARALGIFPQEENLARELGSLAQHREGLTEENVGYALKRNKVEASASEVSAKLRVVGYHRRYAKPYEDEELDF